MNESIWNRIQIGLYFSGCDETDDHTIPLMLYWMRSRWVEMSDSLGFKMCNAIIVLHILLKLFKKRNCVGPEGIIYFYSCTYSSRFLSK